MINLDQAIAQINKVNPFMGNFLNCEQPVLQFCQKKLTTHEFDQVHLHRQKPYRQLIKQKVKKLFNKEDVRIDFDFEPFILDTTDHHYLLNFPTTLGAHLMSRFDTLLDRKNHGDYFVLDCGNVPLSNPLNKRGIEINGKHLNLHPKKDKGKLVSRYPLYKINFQDWINKSEENFSKEEIAFFDKIQKIIDQIDFSTCERFSDQIVKINYYLWQEMFAPDIRDQVRRCITLEHDEILIKFLSQFLLQEQDNIVWKALFDKKYRDLILKEFDGIYGAWNYSGLNTGSHFFWGFSNATGKEYPMRLQGNRLVNPDNIIQDFEMTPQAITQGLKDGILIPSIFTKFTVVAIYMGAKFLGGPGQTEYAEKIKQAWLRVLEKLDSREYQQVQKASLLNMNCADVVFARGTNKQIRKLYGFDIVKQHILSKKYLDQLSQTPFKYTQYPFVPLSYYRLTPASERKKVDCSEQELYQGFSWV